MDSNITQIDDTISQILAALTAPLDQLEAWAASWWLPGESLTGLVAFGVYALVILGGGLLAIGARNLVRAMMGLIVAFLGVAGMYLLLASPFLAFMQLLIYVGAVCVLIFFAIMLTRNSSEGEEAKLPPLSALGYGLLAFLAPLGVIAPFIVIYGPKIENKVPEATKTEILGEGLLREYVLPFELISIILLAAMAGAVYLAFRGFKPVKGGAE